jgi:hypothetical protein
MAGGRCDSRSARERDREGAEDSTHQQGGTVMGAQEDGKSRRCGWSLPFLGYGSVSNTASAGKLRWGVVWFGGLVVWWFGGLVQSYLGYPGNAGCLAMFTAHRPGGIERRSRS